MQTVTTLRPNTIYHMDCISGMHAMAHQHLQPDVIVTSPPYNIGKPYHIHNDNLPQKQYLDWMEHVVETCSTVLSDNGSFFFNIGSKPTDHWTPLELALRCKPYFTLQNVIHWVKSIAIPKVDVGAYPHMQQDIAVGHYQPVNSTKYLSSCHEYIFHFTKHGDVPLDKHAIGVPYQDKSNIGRWKTATQDLRERGNTWFIPYETIQSARPHPTVFPEKLPDMCLRLHGLSRINLVLDPFMGSGSTALACTRLHLDYIGFDIDPEYIAEARRKLKHLG